MQKVIDAFKASPTEANKIKVEKHTRKHRMALCFVSIEDLNFLRSHNVNLEG